MNNEANKRLFALAYPDDKHGWHQHTPKSIMNSDYYKECGICGVLWKFHDEPYPDYFDVDALPHSEVIRLVTAAVEKHGAKFQMMMFQTYGNWQWAECLTLPAPQIAAAIDGLETQK